MVCTTVTVAPIIPTVSGLSAVESASKGYVDVTWTQNVAGAVTLTFGGVPYTVNGTAGTNVWSSSYIAPGTYTVCVA